MADIELVIKIPEDVFKRTMFYREFRDLNDCVTTIKALEKAVPLPKGHGRIVDISQIEWLRALHDANFGYITWIEAIKQIKNSAPTLVEADTESEDK